MMHCDGNTEVGCAHLEVVIAGAAVTPFGVMDLGSKSLGCRSYALKDMPGNGVMSLGHADIDVMVARLLRDIADSLDPLEQAKD